MTSGPASYHFLPWVRSGVAAGIKAPPTLGKTPQPEPGKTSIPSRAPMPVTLRLTGDMSSDDTPATRDDISPSLRMYGPGDVVGIDAREIVRTEPKHLTTDFPPHLFPFVEFDRPDFPWLFTPAAPDGDECLRPWIVLVVVRADLARITADPGRPLPTLECPPTELPDLDESWAWAHAQYVGDFTIPTGLPAALADRPLQTVSRLLCPRRLDPSSGGTAPRYYACLVPAFEAGRKAGLGEPLTEADETLQPAWALTAAGPVMLPVYYHWEFSTGEEGDFEDLVDRLQLLQSRSGAAARTMDLSRPGPGMEYPNARLGLASVLRMSGDSSADLPPELPSGFREKLQGILEAPEKATAGTTPVLAPPIYGRWAAGTPALGAATTPAWLRDLNLDPRYRIAAALGTQVVQRHQEQLVTAAWEQVAQVEAVNQWLRQKQLAREVTASIRNKRLAALSPDSFCQITAPLIAAAGGPEIPRPERPGGGEGAPGVQEDQLAQAVVSAPYRRIARSLTPPASAVAGALAAAGSGEPTTAVTAAATRLAGLLDRIGAGLIQVAPFPGATEGAAAVAGYPLPSAIAPAIREPVTMTATAASPAEEYKAALLGQLDPHTAFKQEAQGRVEVPRGMESTWSRLDALQPVNVTPSFPQPMYEPLRELFQDMVLPGLEQIPNNSLTVLQVNARFIEAYMVGLNHELSRELLWREYPTDLGGTYFRQFWDVRGSAPAATTTAPEPSFDIPPIAQWPGALGGHLRADRGRDLFMLLIRGDLLGRYPTALVYALRARWSKNASNADVAPPVVDTDSPPEFPVMRITPAPGVTLLGFQLPSSPRSTALAPPGNPGWFFVLEEQPTEIRFGLDISRGALTSWRELTWDDVGCRLEGSRRYISVRTPVPTPVPPDPASWGRNAAHMAYITRQQPYRLLVHAARWFPPPQYGYPMSLTGGIGGNLL